MSAPKDIERDFVGFDAATPLQVEHVVGKDWRLLGRLNYAGNSQCFTVPTDFVTDFASVPRPVTFLVPASGKYAPCVVLHDYLVQEKIIPRNEADGILRQSMKQFDVPTFRRYAIWGAVRVLSVFKRPTVLDIVGLVLLAVALFPLIVIALLIGLQVLVVLCLLVGVELMVWAVRRALRKEAGDWKHFWWE